jgi:hypothetical protein
VTKPNAVQEARDKAAWAQQDATRRRIEQRLVGARCDPHCAANFAVNYAELERLYEREEARVSTLAARVEQLEAAGGKAREALVDAAEFGRDTLNWLGPCEHDVGHCVCRERMGVERTDATLALLDAALGGKED